MFGTSSVPVPVILFFKVPCFVGLKLARAQVEEGLDRKRATVEKCQVRTCCVPECLKNRKICFYAAWLVFCVCFALDSSTGLVEISHFLKLL